MGRKDDIDDEWRRFNESLASADSDGEWPIGVERTSFTGGGPRDWSPTEPDPHDDINDLEETINATYEAQEPHRASPLELLLWAIMIGGTLAVVLSLFAVINLSATMTIVILVAVFASLGTWFALNSRDNDDFDDGIRL